MQVIFVGLLFVIITIDHSSGEIQTQVCDAHSGPAGITECVRFQEYDEYQWSTCLSNSYIDNKSVGKFSCRFDQASYCWFQCQLEVFGDVTGGVKNPCKCSPGDKKSFNNSITLPSWCYSPPGDSCSWYKDCLEKRFQCSGTTYEYAIEYGEKFCEEYAKDYQQFSTSGRKWVDGVRKCLQVALVPHLRDFYENTTCKGIKDLALKSYECCYTARSECTLPETPSICDIPCMDWIRVAQRIKDAFVDEPVETVSGIWHIVRQCSVTSKAYTCTTQLSNYMKFLTMDLIFRPSRKRRSTDRLNIDKEIVASDLSESLSTQLKWDANKVDWFVYADGDGNKSENLEINFVLVDKNLKYWTPQHSNTTSSFLDDLMDEMVSKIKEGNVTFITETEGVFVQLNKLSVCDGIRCDNKTLTILPPNNVPPSIKTTAQIATTQAAKMSTTTSNMALTNTKITATTKSQTVTKATVTTEQNSSFNQSSGERSAAFGINFGQHMYLIILLLSFTIYLTK